MNHKIRKTISLMSLTFLLHIPSAFAAPDPERMIDHLREDLSLSEDQEITIREILEEGLTLCDNASSREEHRSCMEENREGIHETIRTTLTEEQQVIFDQLEKPERRRPEGNSGRRGR